MALIAYTINLGLKGKSKFYLSKSLMTFALGLPGKTIDRLSESLSITYLSLTVSRVQNQKIRQSRLSVLGAFLKGFQNSTQYAQRVILSASVIYVLLLVSTPIEMKEGIVFTLIATYLTLVLQRVVLIYRVRKGYYLNCEGEVRELINFVIENADEIDYTGDNGEIISARDIEDIVLETMNSVPAT